MDNVNKKQSERNIKEKTELNYIKNYGAANPR